MLIDDVGFVARPLNSMLYCTINANGMEYHRNIHFRHRGNVCSICVVVPFKKDERDILTYICI